MPKTRKYAIAGETVKIVKPLQFIRCGYPLSIKGIMDSECLEIEKDVARMFAALDRKPIPPDVPEPDLKDDSSVDKWLIDLSASDVPNMSATLHGMLCVAAAAYRLEKANFGGKERKIFETSQGCFEEGQEWTVVSRKTVKTGVRYPASCYREDDYEPGGLDNEKTHCVYTVSRFGHKAKILATNCKKIG